jgi:Outer membrane protein beta-barrel domain
MTARVTPATGVVIGLALTIAVPTASAQAGLAIGPRIAFVRGDSSSNDGSTRFTGGVLRLGTGRTTLELALDYRSSLTGDLLEKVTDMPIQGSMLFYPVRAAIAPYALGGIGWYSQNVKRFSQAGATTPIDEETTRRIGYHAGFGADLRLLRRLSLFGDYRYTFLHFGSDDDEIPDQTPSLIPFAERLKLSHEGSMFTWGAVLHF